MKYLVFSFYTLQIFDLIFNALFLFINIILHLFCSIQLLSLTFPQCGIEKGIVFLFGPLVMMVWTSEKMTLRWPPQKHR